MQFITVQNAVTLLLLPNLLFSNPELNWTSLSFPEVVSPFRPLLRSVPFRCGPLAAESFPPLFPQWLPQDVSCDDILDVRRTLKLPVHHHLPYSLWCCCISCKYYWRILPTLWEDSEAIPVSFTFGWQPAIGHSPTAWDRWSTLHYSSEDYH